MREGQIFKYLNYKLNCGVFSMPVNCIWFGEERARSLPQSVIIQNVDIEDKGNLRGIMCKPIAIAENTAIAAIDRVLGICLIDSIGRLLSIGLSAKFEHFTSQKRFNKFLVITN